MCHNKAGQRVEEVDQQELEVPNDAMVLIVLLSRKVTNPEQGRLCDRALTVLSKNNVEYEICDGSDPEQYAARDLLFQLSGNWNTYPQFFFEDNLGDICYLGDQVLERMKKGTTAKQEETSLMHDITSHKAKLLQASNQGVSEEQVEEEQGQREEVAGKGEGQGEAVQELDEAIDADEESNQEEEDEESDSEEKKPAVGSVRPSIWRGISFDEECQVNQCIVAEGPDAISLLIQETSLQKSETAQCLRLEETLNAARDLRPSILRGNSYDESDALPDQPLEETQLEDLTQTKLALRPSLLRGNSYDDQIPGQPDQQFSWPSDHVLEPQESGKTSFALRPSILRGNSFDDACEDAAQETPGSEQPASSMLSLALRPSIIRGNSFDDFDGGPVAEPMEEQRATLPREGAEKRTKPRKYQQKATKPQDSHIITSVDNTKPVEQTMHPCFLRDPSFEANEPPKLPQRQEMCLTPNTLLSLSQSNETPHSSCAREDKLLGKLETKDLSLRPSLMRGTSFDDSNHGPSKEKAVTLSKKPGSIFKPTARSIIKRGTSVASPDKTNTETTVTSGARQELESQDNDMLDLNDPTCFGTQLRIKKFGIGNGPAWLYSTSDTGLNDSISEISMTEQTNDWSAHEAEAIRLVEMCSPKKTPKSVKKTFDIGTAPEWLYHY